MLLSPVGWLYGKIADFRNMLYEKGVLKSYTLRREDDQHRKYYDRWNGEDAACRICR
jgi:hypothetical protein